MPIRNAIWTVSGTPQPLVEARLPSERVLEDMRRQQEALDYIEHKIRYYEEITR